MRKRYPKILWSDKDERNLISNVRKFNAKITREQRKNPNNYASLPEKINTNSIREKIKSGNFSREDFNRFKDGVRRFMKNDSTQIIENQFGVKTTKWELQEAKYGVKRINKQRKMQKELIKKANPDMTEHGNGLMGDTALLSYEPKQFDFNKIRNLKEWEKMVESIETQSMQNYTEKRGEAYKKGYLTAIKELLLPDGEELYDLVNSLDPHTLNIAYFNDPVLRIQFTSDPLPKAKIVAESLKHWKQWLAKNADNNG